MLSTGWRTFSMSTRKHQELSHLKITLCIEMELHLYNVNQKLNADRNIKAISPDLKGFPLLMPFFIGLV